MVNVKVPSLVALSRASDPFQDKKLLLKRFRGEKAESRHLEWKILPPVGKCVDAATKFRMVKAAVSFANTDGGFIVFGVSAKGKWTGISETAMAEVDPAKLTELFNSCVTPEIIFSYDEIEHDGSRFPMIHVPPSPLMPHVIAKEVLDRKQRDRKTKTILARYGVYCRYGAKSDLATPHQYARIIATRTRYLKDELLRRIKEVPVPVLLPTKSVKGRAPQSAPVIGGFRTTRDPDAPAVRLTRDADQASGYLVHEELSEGLFDEINNVVEANTVLTRGSRDFVLGEKIYYRIYAEREHVKRSDELLEVLAHAGFQQFYAPGIYWLVHMSPVHSGKLIRQLYESPKAPQVHALLRLAVLLGPDVCKWIAESWRRKWAGYPQPPSYYHSFRQMVKGIERKDRRVVALRATDATRVQGYGLQDSLKVTDLLESPTKSSDLLSRASLLVFSGEKTARSVCRQLDILAYGQEIISQSRSIGRAFIAG